MRQLTAMRVRLLTLDFYLTDYGTAGASVRSAVWLVVCLSVALGMMYLGEHPRLDELLDRDAGVFFVFLLVRLTITLSVFVMLLLLAGMGVYFATFWLSTLGRRCRYRKQMTLLGWPGCWLSPRLLRFPDAVWRRLPPWEDMAVTGWCDSWLEGRVRPVSLFATLALMEQVAAGVEDDIARASTEMRRLLTRIGAPQSHQD